MNQKYNQLSPANKRALLNINDAASGVYVYDLWIDNIEKHKKQQVTESRNEVHSFIVAHTLAQIVYYSRPIPLKTNNESKGLFFVRLNDQDELEITTEELSERIRISKIQVIRSLNILEELQVIEKRKLPNHKGLAIKINHDVKDNLALMTLEEINAGKKKEVIGKPQEFKNHDNTQPKPERPDARPVTSKDSYMKPVNSHLDKVERSIGSTNENGIKAWEECKKLIGEKVNSHDEILINSTTFESIDADKKAICLKTSINNDQFYAEFVPLLRSESFQRIVKSVINDYPQFEGKRLFVRIIR